MSPHSPYMDRVLQTLHDLGLPPACLTQWPRPLQEECEDLVSIGPDMFGREQRMQRKAASRWNDLRTAADQDGVELAVVSAFRSFDYQKEIIARKLAAGLSLEQILTVSALPGFSEHHTGRALDLGTPGCLPVIEAFDQTPAFAWLRRRAGEFGFRMSYPRGNQSGVIYEPWHWFCHDPAD